MKDIEVTDLEHFVGTNISVSIQDLSEKDKAPFLEKELKKIALCPDRTHIRLFFDQQRFLAIPRNAVVSQIKNEWIAYDSNSQLSYIIRKVNDFNG